MKTQLCDGSQPDLKCRILRSRTHVSGSWSSIGYYLKIHVCLCWDLKNVVWNMKKEKKETKREEILVKLLPFGKISFVSQIFGRCFSMPQAIQATVDFPFYQSFFLLFGIRGGVTSLPQAKAYKWFGFEIKGLGMEKYPKKTIGNAKLFVKIDSKFTPSVKWNFLIAVVLRF